MSRENASLARMRTAPPAPNPLAAHCAAAPERTSVQSRGPVNAQSAHLLSASLRGGSFERDLDTILTPSVFIGFKKLLRFGFHLVQKLAYVSKYRLPGGRKCISVAGAPYNGVVVVKFVRPRIWRKHRDALGEALSDAVEMTANGDIAVDMSLVRQFHSGPLGAFVTAARRVAAKGGRIYLISPPSDFYGKVICAAVGEGVVGSFPNMRSAFKAHRHTSIEIPKQNAVRSRVRSRR